MHELRTTNGLTQRDLVRELAAQDVRTSVGYISKIERDKLTRPPRDEVVRGLARIFMLDEDELLLESQIAELARLDWRSPKKRAAFLQILTYVWSGQGMHVGLPQVDKKADNEIRLERWMYKIAGPALGWVLGRATGIENINAPGDEEKVVSGDLYRALVEHAEIMDLVAYGSEAGTLFTLICADELAPSEVVQRMDRFMELAVRVDKAGFDGVYNFLHLIYFNEEAYATNMPVLLPHGWRKSSWHERYLRTGFVNVPGQEVVWSPEEGWGKPGRGVPLNTETLSEIVRWLS
jgi:transcriptional regulator with XRE-family HTH domain